MMGASMLPNNDIHELVKLPALVKHYFEHDRTTDSLSFIDFLIAHYTDQTEQTKKEEHKDLPFFHNCPLTIVYTCNESGVPSVVVPHSEFIPVAYAHPIYFFSTQNSVFQPPRV
ncbi:MAG: hypothetical protein IT247_06875 [Bacteroidia bacterium]|nr:hypothetical protein [Bacteroidia bacterium]